MKAHVFLDGGPHAHGPQPRGLACPVRDESTMRDPSLPRLRTPSGTLPAFFPQCSASKGQKVNNIQ